MPGKCPWAEVKAGTAVKVSLEKRGEIRASFMKHLPHQEQDPENIRCVVVKTLPRGVVRSSVAAKVTEQK